MAKKAISTPVFSFDLCECGHHSNDHDHSPPTPLRACTKCKCPQFTWTDPPPNKVNR